ncbi:MAG: aminotransferase class V [Cenarchaeum symbiont of Oopsacas minuta]|nr:aminotransferase class V [Cenarchaeum symbiont of Oopsacas minuta]
MIYLDCHATTPLDSRVLNEMMPYFTDKFGNASSMDHPYGYEASAAVELARKKIATAIKARHDEIIFTSGATESNNIALIGTMAKYKNIGDHLITCTTEHKSILDTSAHLKNIGKKITYLKVNQYGEIDLDELKNAITEQTVIMSIMAANNEIGTISDLKEIGKIAHEKNILFHTDAAQAVGHIPIDVNDMNVDLMSISAHKMYGPKGIGALYVRGIKPRVRLEPIVHGGGQERNIRSGTLNVPGIVGFGKAIEIAIKEMDDENKSLGIWIKNMLKTFENAGGKLNGHPINRLPYNLNISFPGIESKAIINGLSKDIAISSGSACTAQTVEPSHVILALGHDEEYAHSSIRIGLGRFTKEKDVIYCTNAVLKMIKKLKNFTM